MSDAGITCTFVLRIGPKAAIEYSLGPDEMMSFVPVRDGLMAKTSSWRKPHRGQPPTRTSRRPKLSPVNRPMKAEGACSNPVDDLFAIGELARAHPLRHLRRAPH